MSCMVAIMMIAWYGLMDGIKLPLKMKMVVAIMGSMFFLYASFYWTFIASEPCIVEVNWWNFYSSEYDMKEWTAGSVRVITIFMCKQTIYSIWKPTKSTLIKKSVVIQWDS